MGNDIYNGAGCADFYGDYTTPCNPQQPISGQYTLFAEYWVSRAEHLRQQLDRAELAAAFWMACAGGNEGQL